MCSGAILGTAEALAHQDPVAYAAAARRSEGFRPMADAALDLAGCGRTTLEEVVRIAGEAESRA